jgi:hypothetical protein
MHKHCCTCKPAAACTLRLHVQCDFASHLHVELPTVLLVTPLTLPTAPEAVPEHNPEALSLAMLLHLLSNPRHCCHHSSPTVTPAAQPCESSYTQIQLYCTIYLKGKRNLHHPSANPVEDRSNKRAAPSRLGPCTAHAYVLATDSSCAVMDGSRQPLLHLKSCNCTSIKAHLQPGHANHSSAAAH